MKFHTYLKYAVAFSLCLSATAVMAQRGTAELEADGWVLWDYPAIPTTVKPDTVISVEYPWATGGSDDILQGNQALYLGEQARAWYRFADQPVFGEISFLVYDKGASFVHAHSSYGPRWGVQNNPAPNPVPAAFDSPNDQMMGVELTSKSYMDSNLTYNFNISYAAGSTLSDHFSTWWPGSSDGLSTGEHAYRRVDGAAIDNNPLPEDVQVYDQSQNVQGAWARWKIEVHDGQDMSISVSDPDGTTNLQQWTVIPELDSVFDTGFSTTGFNVVHFYGGNTNGNGTEDHVGLWVDDISFVPDVGQGAMSWSEDFDIIPPDCTWHNKGDANCDYVIGLLDLDILGQEWGMIVDPPCSRYNPRADFNVDCEVGLLDLDILGQNWGDSRNFVPEPAMISLMIIGSAAAIRRK